MLERCPLTVAVYSPGSKSRVSAIHTTAVIYRRPDGRYFVMYRGIRFSVVLFGHGFVMPLSTRDWLWCFPPEKKV